MSEEKSAEQGSAPVLELERVLKVFSVPDGQLTAVREISLSLNPGETLAIAGESGCGKSTLARMIEGIEPVSGGSIRFLGQEIAAEGKKMSPKNWKEVRRRMQPVFQNPMDAVSPRMRVGEYLREPFLGFRLCPRDEIGREIAGLLEKVELDESLLRKYPHELSGGELQRISIARALAVHPALLICDEPTSALDVSIQAQVVALLDRLRREESLSILFISHDLALMGQFADRILVMYLGSAVEELPAGQLRRARHPYTRALLRSAFRLDGENSFSPLDGDPPSPLELPPGCPFYSRCPERTERCRTVFPQLRSCADGHRAACIRLE